MKERQVSRKFESELGAESKVGLEGGEEGRRGTAGFCLGSCSSVMYTGSGASIALMRRVGEWDVSMRRARWPRRSC
jgi:hypothetical protein